MDKKLCVICGAEHSEKKKMCSECYAAVLKSCNKYEDRVGISFSDDRGYIHISAPSHPNARKDGYIYEHVFIMSNLINRGLYPDEVIHHINENKGDNRPENLRLERIHTHILNNHRNLGVINSEDAKKIANLYNGGMSSCDIAKEYKCSTPTVLKSLKKSGVKLKQQGYFSKINNTGRSKLTEAQWASLAEEYNSKARPPVAYLAKKYGLSKAMVPRGLKARGHKVRANRWG